MALAPPRRFTSSRSASVAGCRGRATPAQPPYHPSPLRHPAGPPLPPSAAPSEHPARPPDPPPPHGLLQFVRRGQRIIQSIVFMQRRWPGLHYPPRLPHPGDERRWLRPPASLARIRPWQPGRPADPEARGLAQTQWFAYIWGLHHSWQTAGRPWSLQVVSSVGYSDCRHDALHEIRTCWDSGSTGSTHYAQ
ncbi:hypothetical protein U9M48_003896 [Paspalum notatum var. saurae]|uniref:Uncharacterized protein n=1 Tax=Paspalum notatum var. saurae TaxID=547442 RepID=A0AAQ3SIJ6_PASNO